MKIILMVFLFASLALANTCNAIATGNFHTASTWTSCGGTYPQSTDTAVVSNGYTVTADAPITVFLIMLGDAGGTSTGGGSFVDTAGYALTFSSTGAVWQTSMGGVNNCNGGHVTISGATISATGGNPYAIYSNYCGSAQEDPEVFLTGNDFKASCGSAAANIPCMTFVDYVSSTTSGALIGNVFEGGWQPVALPSGEIHYPLFTISGNLFEHFACNGSNHLIDVAGNYYIFSHNTFMNESAQCSAYEPSIDTGGTYATTAVGNAFFDSATYAMPIAMLFGDGPVQASYNIVGLVNSPNSSSTFFPTGTAGSYSTVDHNMGDGVESFIIPGTYSVVTNNLVIANPAVGSQGVLGIIDGESYVTESYNATVLRVPGNQYQIFYQMGSTGTTFNHDTAVMTLPDASGGDAEAYQLGEAGYLIANATVINSIATGSSQAMSSLSGNTYSSVCSWGGGVCNNDVPGPLTSCPTYSGCLTSDCTNHTQPANCGNTNTLDVTTVGGNYDDGVHPQATNYALYHNSAENPVFPDPFRGFASYDAFQGGPGTMADFASCVALFNTPLASVAGVSCLANSPLNFDPHLVWAYMAAGVSPENIGLATAANDGAAVGALLVQGIGEWVQ